jgi:hypothetical protein
MTIDDTIKAAAKAFGELPEWVRRTEVCRPESVEALDAARVDRAIAMGAPRASIAGHDAHDGNSATNGDWAEMVERVAEEIQESAGSVSAAGARAFAEMALKSAGVDQLRHNLQRAHERILEESDRAERSEKELRDFRAEVDGAFKKHGLSAGPNCVDRLVEQRDDAKSHLDAIAKALHPHWGDTTGNGYHPDQLAGMVAELQAALSREMGRVGDLAAALEAIARIVTPRTAEAEPTFDAVVDAVQRLQKSEAAQAKLVQESNAAIAQLLSELGVVTIPDAIVAVKRLQASASESKAENLSRELTECNAARDRYARRVSQLEKVAETARVFLDDTSGRRVFADREYELAQDLDSALEVIENEGWLKRSLAGKPQPTARDDAKAKDIGAFIPEASKPHPTPVYIASRASIPERSAMWRKLRSDGWRITSSWIDEAGPGQTANYADLWARIEREIRAADMLVFYAESYDFPVKGALVEVGMALGMGKPVIVCMPGVELVDATLRPVGSWIRHPLVTRIDNLREIGAMLGRKPPTLSSRVLRDKTDEYEDRPRKIELTTATLDRVTENLRRAVADQPPLELSKIEASIQAELQDSALIQVVEALHDIWSAVKRVDDINREFRKASVEARKGIQRRLEAIERRVPEGDHR